MLKVIKETKEITFKTLQYTFLSLHLAHDNTDDHEHLACTGTHHFCA